MAGIGFKTEELAKRVVKATRIVEGWHAPASGREYPRNPQSTNILWKNIHAQTAPAYAAFEVSDVDIVNGRLVLLGTRPTGTAGKLILFNFREQVPTTETGVAQPGPIVRARFSNGTGANGTTYSVAASSWELATGTQYPVLGKIDDVSNDMFILMAAAGPIRVAMTQTGGSDGTQTTAASWTYSIEDLDGNELDTDHNPLVAPSKCTNPISPGRVTPATAGIAWVAADGTVSVYECNHSIAGAPCG